MELKVNRSLSLPKAKNTEIGVIPEDWEIKNLDEIGQVLVGLTYSPEQVREFGTLVLRSSNIQSNSLAFENNVFVDMQLPERVIVKKDDILICVRNGSRSLIGKCALITKSVEGSAFGAFMAIYRTKNSKYVFSAFQSNIIQKQIENNLGATINQITNKDLKSFLIPLPPLPEQQKIAEALSDTDALIQSLKKLIAKKKDIKQGAMQELLSGKRRLEGFDGEWENVKLGEMLDYIQPTNFIVKSTEYSQTGNLPVLTAGKSFILGYTSEDFGVFEAIPVIIFDDFTTASKFVDFRFKVKSSAMKILKLKSDQFNIRFVFEIMKMIVYPLGDHKRHWIGEYQKIEVFVPGVKEQTRIAQILSDMDAEIEALENQLQKTEDIKQGMMQELLTGRIRLVKPEREMLGMVAEESANYQTQ